MNNENFPHAFSDCLGPESKIFILMALSSPCDQKATNAKSHFSGEAKNCLFFLVLHA